MFGLLACKLGQSVKLLVLLSCSSRMIRNRSFMDIASLLSNQFDGRYPLSIDSMLLSILFYSHEAIIYVLLVIKLYLSPLFAVMGFRF